MPLNFSQCERCGSVGDVTLEKYKDNPNNLIYLCETCRKMEESRQ